MPTKTIGWLSWALDKRAEEVFNLALDFDLAGLKRCFPCGSYGGLKRSGGVLSSAGPLTILIVAG